ncbi:FkbM family methyltransferase [Paenibacillus sp. LMG 31456]|uniref:FkbM family methyltransferase n=1 Tax=Paenibacillus foliorum TaxID=2654974 RepID=A0A972GRD2_9BACL|nr:FkbM family methyltransferase [Paenibacillus foliorum]NOU92417.1 FkbM family methyltransferase [Paenibacillus foliorum]
MVDFVKYNSILREQERPIRFIIGRILMLTGLSKFIIINRDQFKIYFNPTAVTANYWMNPEKVYSEESFFTHFLESGDTVVDVGANIGALTLTAAHKVGDSGKVISVEAHPRTFRFLKNNINLNNFKNIDCYNVAVGENEGYINFSDNISSDDENGVTLDSKGIMIKVEKLDNILKNVGSTITLLKIDVEGFELFVLKGSTKVLQNVKHIYLESWEDHFKKYGYSTPELIRFITSQGFKLFKLHNHHLSAVEGNYVSRLCENLIATKDESELRQRLENYR